LSKQENEDKRVSQGGGGRILESKGKKEKIDKKEERRVEPLGMENGETDNEGNKMERKLASPNRNNYKNNRAKGNNLGDKIG